MSLFDFLLSLILAFNPGISEADFNNVYSILDDTVIHSIVVEDSALDRLSQLADGAVMPLDFTSSDSSNLNSIRTAVEAIRSALGGSSSSTIWSRLDRIADLLGNNTVQTVQYLLNSVNGHVAAVNSALTYGNDSIQSLLSDFRSYFGNSYGGGTKVGYPSMTYDAVTSILNKLGSLSASGGWDDTFTFKILNDFGTAYNDVDMSPVSFFSQFYSRFYAFFTAFGGTRFLNYDGTVQQLADGYFTDYLQLFNSGFIGLRSQLAVPSGWNILFADGGITATTSDLSFAYWMQLALMNLKVQLTGQDRSTAFSFLQEDITLPPQSVTTDNLLDALGIMGMQLQNPLQRLAYVFASPQDLEIRKDVSDNVDQAQEDFFKSDGAGSVKPSNIKDAAGISGGAAGALSSPGSVGDVVEQINNSDNFSFFSQITLGNLDTVPVVVSDDEEDDFIDFYDPANPALWEALGG